MRGRRHKEVARMAKKEESSAHQVKVSTYIHVHVYTLAKKMYIYVYRHTRLVHTYIYTCTLAKRLHGRFFYIDLYLFTQG